MIAFPKPKDILHSKPAVKVYPDGRQVCQETKAGKEEYVRRRRIAWENQMHICPLCLLPLRWEDATTDHIRPRKMGGSERDDSQDNLQAVHLICNGIKGSRRG